MMRLYGSEAGRYWILAWAVVSDEAIWAARGHRRAPLLQDGDPDLAAQRS
jgi:hypothetical protein